MGTRIPRSRHGKSRAGDKVKRRLMTIMLARANRSGHRTKKRAGERRTGQRARKRVTRSLRSSNGKRRVGKMIERRVGRIHPSRDGAREANEGRAREAGMRYLNRYRPVSYRHRRHHRHQCHQRHHRHYQQPEVALGVLFNQMLQESKPMTMVLETRY